MPKISYKDLYSLPTDDGVITFYRGLWRTKTHSQRSGSLDIIRNQNGSDYRIIVRGKQSDAFIPIKFIDEAIAKEELTSNGTVVTDRRKAYALIVAAIKAKTPVTLENNVNGVFDFAIPAMENAETDEGQAFSSGPEDGKTILKSLLPEISDQEEGLPKWFFPLGDQVREKINGNTVTISSKDNPSSIVEEFQLPPPTISRDASRQVPAPPQFYVGTFDSFTQQPNTLPPGQPVSPARRQNIPPKHAYPAPFDGSNQFPNTWNPLPPNNADNSLHPGVTLADIREQQNYVDTLQGRLDHLLALQDIFTNSSNAMEAPIVVSDTNEEHFAVEQRDMAMGDSQQAAGNQTLEKVNYNGNIHIKNDVPGRENFLKTFADNPDWKALASHARPTLIEQVYNFQSDILRLPSNDVIFWNILTPQNSAGTLGGRPSTSDPTSHRNNTTELESLLKKCAMERKLWDAYDQPSGVIGTVSNIDTKNNTFTHAFLDPETKQQTSHTIPISLLTNHENNLVLAKQKYNAIPDLDMELLEYGYTCAQRISLSTKIISSQLRKIEESNGTVTLQWPKGAEHMLPSYCINEEELDKRQAKLDQHQKETAIDWSTDIGRRLIPQADGALKGSWKLADFPPIYERDIGAILFNPKDSEEFYRIGADDHSFEKSSLAQCQNSDYSPINLVQTADRQFSFQSAHQRKTQDMDFEMSNLDEINCEEERKQDTDKHQKYIAIDWRADIGRNLLPQANSVLQGSWKSADVSPIYERDIGAILFNPKDSEEFYRIGADDHSFEKSSLAQCQNSDYSPINLVQTVDGRFSFQSAQQQATQGMDFQNAMSRKSPDSDQEDQLEPDDHLRIADEDESMFYCLPEPDKGVTVQSPKDRGATHR